MTFAAIFLILMVIIFVILGSRNSDHHDYDGYHEDPYYYYPRNPAPRYGGGYHQPYYPPPQYPPYPPQYQQPYHQPYQQPYQPHIVRPEPSGNSLVFGMVMFIAVAFGAFTIAAKMGLVSASITIGDPKQERIERPALTPQPENGSIGGVYQKYSKDPPRK